MSNYYIKSLTISGQNMTDSSIDFDKGLNIIHGPSNTGKSYIVQCIDYLFGGNDSPIDTTTGYDCISLILETSNGNIKLSRELDSKSVNVDSQNSIIESGKYKLNGDFDKNLYSIWLKLIGINDQYYIIKNKNFEKRKLTWRTFCHTFLLTEERIIGKDSIMLPKTVTNNTATISALIFLITGNNFGDLSAKEDKKIKEVKTNAVVNYINNELSDLAERKAELLDSLSQIDVENLENEFNEIINEIENIEETIASSMRKNQILLSEIFSINEKLTESRSLQSKYQDLKTQYTSDIKRLSLILDGQINSTNINISKCPFCDNNIQISESPDYLEASKAEYRKINLQLKDLNEAINSITTEIDLYDSRVTSLEEQKNKLEYLINDDLKPKIIFFQNELKQYQSIIEKKNELRLLDELSISMNQKIIHTTNDEESTLEFKPKEHLTRNILDKLDECLKNIFESCNKEKTLSVRFDRTDMDIVVNGKDKKSQGKGYRAFYNSLLATSFAEYLLDYGIYSPSLLILDSPILSLKEPDSEVTNSMKESLFKYFVDNQKGIQTIIVENNIPNINYDKINIIKFTKDRDNGRYGLLYDIYE